MPRSYLFIHQNFPGQLGQMAQALLRQGNHVHALLSDTGRGLHGVTMHKYRVPQGLDAHKPVNTPFSDKALMPHLQAQLQRASAAARVMQQLKRSGFRPDVIVAHPGWGEALFCKDIWPQAKLVIFSEWFYNAHGADAGFDPEFSSDDGEQTAIGIRLKNTVHLHAYHAADAIFTPTRWQRAQVPEPYRSKVQIIPDHIDTRTVKPDPQARIRLLKTGKTFQAGDEVITFVNRNLEPYRGFHIFMRALPGILQARPRAHAILVGGNAVSYGKAHPSGKSWKHVMLQEVGAQLPEERVHFVGKVPYGAYLNLLQVSACHVYLTYPFVLSWSCLEGMAAGCAVVAGNTPPVREIIRHKANGLLVDFFDPRQLTHTVEHVIAERNDPTIQAMRAQARQTVLEHCDPQAIAQAWQALLA